MFHIATSRFDQTHRIHFLAKNVPLYNASSV
ncbi:hypothetical protein AYX14_07085 [Cryptococcus neoformans]|nr:hypothetical protein AYX14_07085 [Cryptococcus neoformans var. grubii]